MHGFPADGREPDERNERPTEFGAAEAVVRPVPIEPLQGSEQRIADRLAGMFFWSRAHGHGSATIFNPGMSLKSFGLDVRSLKLR